MTTTTMPPSLTEALDKQTPERRQAFLDHLKGGTSADWLAGWLKRAGTPVSATTLKLYRRSIA